MKIDLQKLVVSAFATLLITTAVAVTASAQRSEYNEYLDAKLQAEKDRNKYLRKPGVGTYNEWKDQELNAKKQWSKYQRALAKNRTEVVAYRRYAPRTRVVAYTPVVYREYVPARRVVTYAPAHYRVVEAPVSYKVAKPVAYKVVKPGAYRAVKRDRVVTVSEPVDVVAVDPVDVVAVDEPVDVVAVDETAIVTESGSAIVAIPESARDEYNEFLDAQLQADKDHHKHMLRGTTGTYNEWQEQEANAQRQYQKFLRASGSAPYVARVHMATAPRERVVAVRQRVLDMDDVDVLFDEDVDPAQDEYNEFLDARTQADIDHQKYLAEGTDEAYNEWQDQEANAQVQYEKYLAASGIVE